MGFSAVSWKQSSFRKATDGHSQKEREKDQHENILDLTIDCDPALLHRAKAFGSGFQIGKFRICYKAISKIFLLEKIWLK